ncbi:MAG: hypothetical protein E7620_01880 [Ruminococcaceae bacterium]|nr:hypothetical protein [Oscillospiraceae bacterium]
MKRKRKPRVVYLEDKGETIYSMAALDGRTPEEQEEFDRKRKQQGFWSRGERRAMIAAAFSVYGPLFLCVLVAFLAAALLMYFFLK